jgi:hypothetical protein
MKLKLYFVDSLKYIDLTQIINIDIILLTRLTVFIVTSGSTYLSHILIDHWLQCFCTGIE